MGKERGRRVITTGAAGAREETIIHPGPNLPLCDSFSSSREAGGGGATMFAFSDFGGEGEKGRVKKESCREKRGAGTSGVLSTTD